MLLRVTKKGGFGRLFYCSLDLIWQLVSAHRRLPERDNKAKYRKPVSLWQNDEIQNATAKTFGAAEMSTDWFRNTTWDEHVESVFNQKLRRAKKKAQYLRIQAATLAEIHPEVALKLLDQYFLLDDNFEHSLAHVHRAQAFLALGRVDDAIRSYEAALAREIEFPNVRTRAYLDLPYLVSTLGIKEKYAIATRILEMHERELVFPVDHFLWHASHALMAVDGQNFVAAKNHAKQALDAAASEHSGFRYHSKVGLVTEQYDSVIRKLEACCAA